jgi:putative ATP-binding cassette transporter
MRLFTTRFTDAIDDLRLSLLRRIFSADHFEIADIGSHHISIVLSRTFDIILESAPAIVICTHCAVEIILGFIYLFLESSTSVAIAMPFIGFGAAIILTTGLRLNNLRTKLQGANTLLEENSHLIASGLRESRVNAWRALRVYNGFIDRVQDVRNQRIKTNDMFIINFASAELVYFSIGGAIIFILPGLITINQLDLIFVVNSASFMAYPALLIALFSLSLVDASAAAQEVTNIETRLPDREWMVSAPPTGSELVGFSRLSLSDACFEYNSNESSNLFKVGPINLTIEAGSIVFITGLNGTGKSTLLHMLLALYPLASGTILLDGERVTEENLQKYYRLFSIDFPDCHLAETILGVREVDTTLAKELLEIFEMSGKVSIENGAFSTISLSHGQRKRLSLIASLLEKRPILVLDEWAADQSPAFRATFYKKILPWIKSRGITVIAITHDDAYFEVADLQIELENGRIREVSKENIQISKGDF